VSGIIKVKSASYKRYEELLLKKDSLLKEAHNYQMLYEHYFDELIREVQQTRLDCVRKRKILSYCKSRTVQGLSIVKESLDEFVEKAMNDYQETLDYLRGADSKTENKKEASEDEQKAIKAIYHQLAKQIHPDMIADLAEDQTISDLWNRTCIAYNCNNLEELQELEILINRYLESIHHSFVDVEIPDVNEKIFILNREIYKITHTNPYQYRYIVLDEDNVAKKKDELSKELADYKRYIEELNKELDVFETLIEE